MSIRPLLRLRADTGKSSPTATEQENFTWLVLPHLDVDVQVESRFEFGQNGTDAGLSIQYLERIGD
jgi:hypothetical protein